MTGLTWLAINALRPDLRAGDDRLIFVALADYLQSAFLHFDFGRSSTSGREIEELIRQGLPADLSLLGGGMFFGLLGGIAGGAYCAARPRTTKTRALEGAAALAMCAPVYVVGLLILLLFGSGLGMVEPFARIPTTYVPFAESPLRWAGALAVPWLVLGLPLAGVSLRMMRAAMTDVMTRTTCAPRWPRGCPRAPSCAATRSRPPSRRCSRSPIVTMPVVVTNLVLIEQVFSIPGVFTGMRRGIAAGDFDLLFALTAVAAGFVAVAGLLADFALTWLDPRMRTRAGS